MSLRNIDSERVSAYAEGFAADSDVFVTSSRVSDFTDILYALEEHGSEGEIRILTDAETAKAVRRRFLVASYLVDHIERGTVSVRQREGHLPSFIVADDDVTAITGVDESNLTVLTTDDEAFVTGTGESLEQQYADAAEVSFRTPAYSGMLDQLGDDLGSEMRADVETALGQAAATRSDETSVDPVRLSILMGAKNEVQFYELGNWGESTGVGSKAKFSREKRQLEDVGLIDTEKIPKDIGRPRQRLVLGKDVDDVDATELLSLAESVSAA
ncbi:transcriptional regulator TbsP domain-containing protein [Natronomonas amylolytica]|uniref:transcriptional regulator TbsP domain-containing protein n=1 Tax=Natronomonas amylolytica TaxID=3108498 RepID=UPI00300A8380